MKEYKEGFDHLIRNLERVNKEKSILNHTFSDKALFPLGKGNLSEWLGKLLPNTRLIIEPKITGIGIAIQYKNGKLIKVINKDKIELSKKTNIISKLPEDISIMETIEILGQLYKPAINKADYKKSESFQETENTSLKEETRFCAFQILNCNLNHFQSLKELKKLGFQIPEIESTNDITHVPLIHKYWKERIIFKNYPTRGIVLKVNSKKLQKILGKNKDTINWAYQFY